MKNLTEKQALTIKYAYNDLKGALEAQQEGDLSLHDWGGVEETLKDLIEEFDFIEPVED